MNGRKPTKAEQEWLDQVIDLPCIVCRLEKRGATPAEVHHINGSRKPDAHFDTIPLCVFHHRVGNDNEQYTSRHPFKKRFEKRYGTEAELLQKTREIIQENHNVITTR